MSPTDHVSSLRPNLFTHTSETMSDYPRNGVWCFWENKEIFKLFCSFQIFFGPKSQCVLVLTAANWLMYWSISERKPSQRSIKLCNWSLHSVCSRAHFLWLGQVGDKTSKRLHHSCLHFGRNKLSKHWGRVQGSKN